MLRFVIWLQAVLVSPGLEPPPSPPDTGAASSSALLSVDENAIPLRPYARLQTLFEKTLLRIDVLTLEIRVDSVTANRVQQAIERTGGSDLRDTRLVELVMGAPDAWARMEFKRSASAGQFFDGIRRNLEGAMAADFIDPDYLQELTDNLPRWFDFLEGRGVQKGDVLLYRIHGDSLRTVFQGAEGVVLLDEVDPEPRARFSILGGYLAPGSPFRKGLLRSVSESRRGRN